MCADPLWVRGQTAHRSGSSENLAPTCGVSWLIPFTGGPGLGFYTAKRHKPSLVSSSLQVESNFDFMLQRSESVNVGERAGLDDYGL